MPCVDAFDCSNTTLVMECYESNNFRDDTFFCDCSNWFGWIGPNCDEPSSTLAYLKVQFGVFTFWHLINISILGRVMFIYLKFSFKTFNDINPIFYVALFEILATICFLLYELLQVPSFYDSDFYETQNSKSLVFSSTGIERKYSTVTDVFKLFGGIFQGFSALQIVFSWLAVLEQFNRTFAFQSYISEKQLKKIFLSIGVVVILFFIILVSINAVDEGTLAFTIAALILTIAYIVGYCRFRSRMKDVFDFTDGTQEARSINLVKKSAKINTLCFTMVLILTLIYYVGSVKHLEIMKIGGFNYFFVIIDLSFVFAIYQISYTAYYAHRIVIGAASKESTLAVPFYSFWCCFERDVKPSPSL